MASCTPLTEPGHGLVLGDCGHLAEVRAKRLKIDDAIHFSDIPQVGGLTLISKVTLCNS
jgi:hypothetical protein